MNMRKWLEKNKWAYVIIGIVSMAIVTIFLVGLINGVWPWTKGMTFGDYIGSIVIPEETQSTEQTTEPTGTQETTDGTQEEGSGDIRIPLDDMDTENDTTTETEDVPQTDSTEETKAPSVISPDNEISFDDLLDRAEGKN